MSVSLTFSEQHDLQKSSEPSQQQPLQELSQTLTFSTLDEKGQLVAFELEEKSCEIINPQWIIVCFEA